MRIPKDSNVERTNVMYAASLSLAGQRRRFLLKKPIEEGLKKFRERAFNMKRNIMNLLRATETAFVLFLGLISEQLLFVESNGEMTTVLCYCYKNTRI